ncbi:MAG TPA: NADH-quinone oxidoreductase subunit B family protein [Nitrospirota bacterium]|nr:NADH-quinone oxidoreductase subunit B family protein [Nitrospirota bacterium]
MLKDILQNIISKKKVIPFPEGFSVTADQAAKIVDFQGRIDKIFGRSLRIRQVDAGSCNACEWECTALTNPIYDIQRFGIDFVASPRHADVLLVTGPVSRQMELALKRTYIATPEPRLVVACGDCAKDGGIYKGSYAVTNGVANVVPVDCYIPGCPPTPTAILLGLSQLIDRCTR